MPAPDREISECKASAFKGLRNQRAAPAKIVSIEAPAKIPIHKAITRKSLRQFHSSCKFGIEQWNVVSSLHEGAAARGRSLSNGLENDEALAR